MKHFQEDSRSAYAAKAEVQRIAFAPVIFQTCRVLLKSGVLELVQQSGKTGLLPEEVAAQIKWPRYGVKVLLESGLGIGLFCLNDGRYTLAKLGFFVLRDPVFCANMDFIHDVCYRGLFHLDEAVANGKPAGLKTFGKWATVYEGLASLPASAQRSWFAFDHYYSDGAFAAALPLVFATPTKRLLDVGGNTGRWAVQCTKFDPHVHVTIVDLPKQLKLARQTIRRHKLQKRVDCLALDVLDETKSFPENYDAIWMSQFLDCFSEAEIVSILRRTARAMNRNSHLFILEPLWDRQANDVAAFCLQQISLYFTCIANGNSQMYHSSDLFRCLAAAGLKAVEQHDQVGSYHTLLKCRKV